MIKKVTRHEVIKIDQGQKTTLQISFDRDKSTVVVRYYLFRPNTTIDVHEERIDPDSPEYILACALHLDQINGDAEDFAFMHFRNKYMEAHNPFKI